MLGTSIHTTGSQGLQVKNGLSTVASINQAGAIVGTSCQINGSNVLTATYRPFFCCSRVNGNATKAYSSGRVDFTVSRIAGLGNYYITYTSAYPNNNYVIVSTAIGNFADAGVGANHNTDRAHVYTWITNNQTLLDNAFFYVF